MVTPATPPTTIARLMWWAPAVPLVLGLVDCGAGLMLLAEPASMVDSPGFERAVAALGSVDPARARRLQLLISPPYDLEALTRLPRQLASADALFWPRPTEVVVLARAGGSTPVGLDDYDAAEIDDYGGVQLSWFRLMRAEDGTAIDQDPGGAVLFDLWRQLAGTLVTLVGPQGSVACDRPHRGGFHCRNRPLWNNVSPVTTTVEGRPYNGVWAHPVQDRRLVLNLGQVPLGQSVILELALADAAVYDGGAPVVADIVFHSRGATIRRSLTRTNQRGVARLQVDGADLGLGPQAEVRIELTTPRDARRHTLLNFRSRRARERPLP